MYMYIMYTCRLCTCTFTYRLCTFTCKNTCACTYTYRLYTKVKVSTRFIKPRAEGGTRFDKSSRDHTEVYNALLPCYSSAFHSRTKYSN